MDSVLTAAQRRAKEVAERSEKAVSAEHATALRSALPSLAENVKSGMVTVSKIDSLHTRFPDIPTELMGYFLSKKGYLLEEELGVGVVTFERYFMAVASRAVVPR